MKTPVLKSLFNKVADLQASNFIKKRCFPVNIAKILRTPILKKICEQQLLTILMWQSNLGNCEICELQLALIGGLQNYIISGLCGA